MLLSSEEPKRATASGATIIPPIVRRYTLELHFCIGESKRAAELWLASAAKNHLSLSRTTYYTSPFCNLRLHRRKKKMRASAIAPVRSSLQRLVLSCWSGRGQVNECRVKKKNVYIQKPSVRVTLLHTTHASADAEEKKDVGNVCESDPQTDVATCRHSFAERRNKLCRGKIKFAMK